MSKQVIIIRKDLNMRKGKMCAQAAHASMKVFLDKGNLIEEYSFKRNNSNKYLIIPLNENEFKWISGSFKKIVVYVESESELIDLYNKANNAMIPCSLIIDNGATEFKGVKTMTAVAIGPDNDDIIDQITGYLPLL